MKVVLDANVFVSAAIQKGPSHRIVVAWFGGQSDLDLVMCPELIAEVRDVLTTRHRLRKWIRLEDATIFVDAIELAVDLVDDPDVVAPETRDADDGYLIALARAHRAEKRAGRRSDVPDTSGSGGWRSCANMRGDRGKRPC